VVVVVAATLVAHESRIHRLQSAHGKSLPPILTELGLPLITTFSPSTSSCSSSLGIAWETPQDAKDFFGTGRACCKKYLLKLGGLLRVATSQPLVQSVGAVVGAGMPILAIGKRSLLPI
jgi:hypothetical protein